MKKITKQIKAMSAITQNWEGEAEWLGWLEVSMEKVHERKKFLKVWERVVGMNTFQ
jgi:hypothetical protein